MHVCYACNEPCKHQLQARGALEGVLVERATFVEVTRAAVLAALASPRELSAPLVCPHRCPAPAHASLFHPHLLALPSPPEDAAMQGVA